MTMKTNRSKVALLGGDRRMRYAADSFAETGAEAAVFACPPESGAEPGYTRAATLTDALGGADVVVLPIPTSRDGVTLNAPLTPDKLPLDDIVRAVPERATVYGGKLGKDFTDKLKERGIKYYDYAEDRYYAAINAAYTAEAAFAIAVESTDKALKDCSCAIFGMGRIGKVLSGMLRGAGARVTVFTRNPRDADFIEYMGMDCRFYDGCEKVLPECDLLINTVPDGSITIYFDKVPSRSPIIDLAGVNSDLPNVTKALSLPSKYSPESAGRLICRAILHSMDGGER